MRTFAIWLMILMAINWIGFDAAVIIVGWLVILIVLFGFISELFTPPPTPEEIQIRLRNRRYHHGK